MNKMISIEGKIVNIEGITRGRIEIDHDGLILSVGPITGKADLVLKDELIFPGFVDIHVHARECTDHSWDYKEDFYSASSAAITGGVVAFADMPNNPVPPTDDKSYNDKYQLAKNSAINVVLYAGIGKNSKLLERKAPYKVFMGKSVGELFFNNIYELNQVLQNFQNQSVSFHCEDPEILEKNANQPTHELRRPREAEIKAIDFVLELIKKYQLQGKICHVSTAEGLNKIVAAKKQGINVTCEVAPHHLYFDESIFEVVGAGLGRPLLVTRQFLQVNPPLRKTSDQMALIKGLKDRSIDYLATDHAPHTVAEKAKGLPTGQAGMSGMPHLDTYGPFASWLIQEHQFKPEDIARVCSFNPGKFLNQFSQNKYGKIEPGFAGSLTIIDMNRPIKIEKSMLKTKCAWSPFEGMTFPGSVVYTIIKGKIYAS